MICKEVLVFVLLSSPLSLSSLSVCVHVSTEPEPEVEEEGPSEPPPPDGNSPTCLCAFCAMPTVLLLSAEPEYYEGEVSRGNNGWIALADEGGYVYYFNDFTGATQWEKPEGYDIVVDEGAL